MTDQGACNEGIKCENVYCQHHLSQEKTHSHHACGYGYCIKGLNGETIKTQIYRGDDAANEFITKLIEDTIPLFQKLYKIKPLNPLRNNQSFPLSSVLFVMNHLHCGTGLIKGEIYTLIIHTLQVIIC